MSRQRQKSKLLRVHSSLELGTFQRLAALAERENSSVARIVKLAIVEFLDEHPASATPNRTTRQNRRGAWDNGDQGRRRASILQVNF
jgi:hypothetical protein